MSIERRLLLGMALSVVLVFALLLGGGTFAVREITEAYVYARLQQDAQALLAALRRTPEDGAMLRQRHLSPVYQQPFSGHYFVVQDSQGNTERSRSLWDETLAGAPVAPGEARRSRAPGPAGQDLLVYNAGFERQGQHYTVTTAEDMTPLARQIRRYQAFAAAGFLLTLIVLLAAQRQIVRGALKGLDRLREEVREVGTGHRQALSDAVPLEVRPLVREFNRLLSALAQRLERSRHAVGNLAHAIKTPLSLLTSELGRERATDRTLAFSQLARIRQLLERELRRARIAGSGLPGQQFDAAADIPALLESLRRLHRGRALTVEADLEGGAALPIDREDALELLGNLLDNACKWAKSRVCLTVRQEPTELSLTVEDDGAGVAEAELDRLASRGARADESIEGHGLGLSIASDIARGYGGTLAFDRSPGLGGLRVRALLPLARDEMA